MSSFGGMMRTTLTLDDKLSKQVLRFTHAPTLAAAVGQALKEYVRRQELMGFAELRGKIHFEPGYDYKANRRADRN
jgi:Arc/MetJ family transcription regulator